MAKLSTFCVAFYDGFVRAASNGCLIRDSGVNRIVSFP